MIETKADARAAREACGISHAHAAEALNVREQTVKRWENPRYEQLPEDYIEWLGERMAEHRRAVDGMLALARSSDADEVRITYYRTQAQYDAWHDDGASYSMANAVARDVAARLTEEGFEVRFVYPGE